MVNTWQSIPRSLETTTHPSAEVGKARARDAAATIYARTFPAWPAAVVQPCA